MHQEDQRNFIIAIVLMVLMVLGYQALFNDPAAERAREQAAREQTAQEPAAAPSEADSAAPDPASAATPAQPAPAPVSDVRIPFDGPGVDGSIRLAGAMIDDLKLKRHFTTPEKEQELILLRPRAERHGFYATYLWGDASGRPVAGVNSDWTLLSGDRLTPATPVTLRFEGGGLRVDRTILLDDNYMFAFQDEVTNIGAGERQAAPLGVIRRQGQWKEFVEATDPSGAGSGIGFKGLIGVIDGNLRLRNYQKADKGQGFPGDVAARTSDAGGWVGLTDKYFMAALAPQQDRAFTGAFYRREAQGAPLFEVQSQGRAVTLAPGESVTVTNHVFAGAKRMEVLQAYEESLGLPRFEDAVDWGLLYFLTKPFFWALRQLESLVGSFGLAILAFTVLVKIVLFPLYNRSYKSMAKMKKLQEPMKEISERYKDDPQERQKAIMRLFQEHKANPIAGCVPIIATMPVFFALYQTLAVTIEMRHTPFLFLDDLSAPDPTAVGNLFGLLSPLYSAEAVKSIPILGLILGVGILPVLYGLTMWALQSLSPPPTDEMQRRIIQFLPVIFTFVFAGFAAGLVVYWLWSNILSILQQYIIMRQNGVETELDKLIARLRGRPSGAA